MPYTIAEELILPYANDINRILSGKYAESNLSTLSVKAIQHRISLMSEHSKNQVIDQVKSAGSFARQLDESADILLVAFIMISSSMSFCAF